MNTTHFILCGKIHEKKKQRFFYFRNTLKISKKITIMEGEPRIVGDGVSSESSQVRRRAQPQGCAGIHNKLNR